MSMVFLSYLDSVAKWNGEHIDREFLEKDTLVLSLGVEFILIYDFYILGHLFIYLFIYFYKF
jgi:hypothetical protein